MSAAPLNAFTELARLGLESGDIMEVLWKITPDNEGPDEEKWWPAKLVADEHPARDAEGRAVWTLIYEAFEDFSQEEREVVFLGEHDLLDVDGEEEMVWRKQGDAWEPPELTEAEHTYTADEVARMMEAELSDVSGGQTEEEMMRTLQSAIPPEKLLQGASAMREFIEKFKQHVQNAAAAGGKENGEGFVVTKSIVEDFTRSLK